MILCEDQFFDCDLGQFRIKVLQEIGFGFQNAVFIRCEEFVAVSCRSQFILFLDSGIDSGMDENIFLDRSGTLYQSGCFCTDLHYVLDYMPSTDDLSLKGGVEIYIW